MTVIIFWGLFYRFCRGGVFAIVVASLGDNREPDRAFGIAQAVQGLVMGALFAWAPSLMSESGINSLFYLMAILALTTMIFVPQFPRRGVVDAAPVPADSAGDPPSSAPIRLLGSFRRVCLLLGGLWLLGLHRADGYSRRSRREHHQHTLYLSACGNLWAFWRPVQRNVGRFLLLLIALVGQLWVFVLVGRFPPGRLCRACYQGLYVMATRISLASLHTLIRKENLLLS